MTVRYDFSNQVPSWTKIGSAEFFSLLDTPRSKSDAIVEMARQLNIKWDTVQLYVESQDNETLDRFLTFVANWYTKNRLSVVVNYDLILKNNNDLEPTPRPAPQRYMPSNSSNIKPRTIKEIKLDELSDLAKQKFLDIKNNGINGLPAEKFKTSKIYPMERYLEYTVIPTSGKRGKCFGCSKEDLLTYTKETQFPLTVGLENYANFYSYHSKKIGFCKTCSISNHLSFGKVLYNISNDTSKSTSNDLKFFAIPTAAYISEIIRFFEIIELSYPKAEFIKRSSYEEQDDSLSIFRGNNYWTNFVEQRFSKPGFYFSILILFTAISNSVNRLIRDAKDKQTLESPQNKKILEFLFPKVAQDHNKSISGILLRSWEFMLSKEDLPIRYWRYPDSTKIMRLLDNLRNESNITNLLSIIQNLIYNEGNSIVDTNREDFSRSLLLGKPDIGILEEAVWEIMSRGGFVEIEISQLAFCLVEYKFGGKNMGNDEDLKQCRNIGRAIAELSIEDKNKGLLYELRSVGNSQALRAYLEKYTFTCALRGKHTTITNEFISKIFDGMEWKLYKSIIAIVANQQYSYQNNLKKEETPK